MSEKRDFLFRFVHQSIRKELLFDEEALYSTTDQVTADKITSDIASYVPSHGVVIDGTACIGGNTYSFARVFHKVIAYEIDPQRALFLAHNMKTLGMQNVECVHGDLLQQIVAFPHHVHCIFLDPPWGGPEYKNQEKLQLFLSSRPLSDVCRSIAHKTNYIAIKVPINFDETSFQEACQDFLRLQLRDTQLRKMHLLIYKVCQQPRNDDHHESQIK